MNDFYSLVSSRESCRDYSDREVEQEKLEKIIEYARLAPSARNMQPWEFVVVSGERANAVRRATQFVGRNLFTTECPSFIIISEEIKPLDLELPKEAIPAPFADVDIGIVTAHICLAATELGLSSCIMGLFDAKMLREEFDIAENLTVRLVVSIGYAKDENLREKKRKAVSEIAKFIK